jgi:membrane protease YdiL (CAAX protease family)
MNPLTRLYRGSRAFRVLCYFLMVPAVLLVFVVSDDMWARYTQVGDLTLFIGFMFFAAWAWWYGEDRDRRRTAKAEKVNGAGTPGGAGSPDADGRTPTAP